MRVERRMLIVASSFGNCWLTFGHNSRSASTCTKSDQTVYNRRHHIIVPLIPAPLFRLCSLMRHFTARRSSNADCRFVIWSTFDCHFVIIRNICIRASKQRRLQSMTTNNCSTHPALSFSFSIVVRETLHCAPYVECWLSLRHSQLRLPFRPLLNWPSKLVIIIIIQLLLLSHEMELSEPYLDEWGNNPSNLTIQICQSVDYSLTTSHKHWTLCECWRS